LSADRWNRLAATCLLAGACAAVSPAGGAAHAAGRLVQVNHHQIYYEIHGSGRPLVLLHGGGDSFEYSFARVLPALSAEAQMLSVGAKLKQLWLTSPEPAELSPAILSTIAQPVMIMAGDHDEIRIEHTLEIFRALPIASLWIVPDCGHNVFNERPQLAQRVLLEFLEKP
jgi:pimeloyl-ACP methyl ester carboxylesterase